MPLLTNISCLATCRPEGVQRDIHCIPNAALAWRGADIRWVGAQGELPDEYKTEPQIDAQGYFVIPGLIDCHTHLAFAGWRADEFEMRLKGRSYLEIARAGGGILSTVRATREATVEELRRRCLGFLREMSRLGVTTVECKSGYGLDLESEMKLLRVYRQLSSMQPLRIVPTLLGAHTIPVEYRQDRRGYVDLVCEEMIPEAASDGLARFCDVFLEETAFTWEESHRVLRRGLEHGLKPKIHADQLRGCGGAELAAEIGAISADHLEKISQAGIEGMAQAGVVAVSLPLATLHLNQPPMPARRLIEVGVRVAVATDFNPGSAPCFHLPLAMMLACHLQRMTPAEALKGATIHAAQALGMEDRIGSLEPGKAADFAIIEAQDVNGWLYHFRENRSRRVFVAGEEIDDDRFSKAG